MVQRLEDYSGFNAGRGAVFTNEGTVELDASIMDGRSGAAGAVACVRRVKNPVLAAKRVMEHGEHVLLISRGAEQFCLQQGLDLVENDYFKTAHREKQWITAQETGKFITCIDTHSMGTVGAVARDMDGFLAAATSTGGRVNQLAGRVGDSPLIGAGTWADNNTLAISGTGDGERFIRAVFAHEVQALVQYGHYPLAEACDLALEKVNALGGVGGCVAIDKHGNGAMRFNTNAMYYGYVNDTGHVEVQLYRKFPS